ncbi:MAG: (6-4) photolyase [Pseudomonadota bacterium]
MSGNLIVVLGDQLSFRLSAFRDIDPTRDRVVMIEARSEGTYVKHHKKKIILILAAMRHFADALRARGIAVDYVTLDDPDNAGSLTSELKRIARVSKPQRIVTTAASEWRVVETQKSWEHETGVAVEIRADHRFIASIDEFKTWAQGRKQLRMEYFYRDMRRKAGLLMDGDEPIGGQWNFDHENRKPAKADLLMPKPHKVTPSKHVKDVTALVERTFGDHFGNAEPFWFAVTHEEAERALDHFVKHALPRFGDYQDAMLTGEPFLYHSLLSAYINIGLLDPLEVCRRVEAAWRAGKAPLNAAEGYIRQIIGWREYIRGIYWLKMPDYVDENFFGHARPVPDFYWTADTKMACIKAAVTQTRDEAYAHHIQRLMVTGNFALLAGIDPKALHEWYLSVYIDAFEWVELPNTLGMSQFGDGGLLASKPYAASGAYIKRMSDYCGDCVYDVKARATENACPFNALYWDFLVRNRSKLAKNPRMAQMYRVYDKFADDERTKITARAKSVLKALK